MNVKSIALRKNWLTPAALLLGLHAALSLLLRRGFLLTTFGDLTQCILLLLCTLAILPNAAAGKGRTRLFWLLMAAGFGAWLAAQMLWSYFEVFLRREVPNPFVGDVVLFLHIVPLMAALALEPHMQRNESGSRFGSLDFLLLLIWWLYLFLFVVIPWQYVCPSEAVYGRSFDVLYLSEHIVFLFLLGFVWRCSTGSWKVIYGHFLGAASLYATSSIAASIAIDFHCYYTGSLYDLPLIASITWFISVGLIARTLSPEMREATTSFPEHGIWAARLAMLAVFSTPFMVVWAVFGGHAPEIVRTYRLVLTLGVMLLMGCLVFAKQHWLDRELIHLLQASLNNLDEMSRLKDDLLNKEKSLRWYSMELQRKNVELQEISFTDSLTGLWNRRYLEEVMAADAGLAVRNCSRAHEHATGDLERHNLVFLMVDVDSFKKVNDDYGHAVGDELLREVAKRLSKVVRKSDLLVRWGGEEFLIMSRSAELLGVPVFCRRILDAISLEPFDLGNNINVRKTCSVGWASYPWCGDAIEAICPEEVIELADTALYDAKASGKNQSVGYVPSDIAIASPERINFASLREERSRLIKTIRTSSENQLRTAASAPG